MNAVYFLCSSIIELPPAMGTTILKIVWCSTPPMITRSCDVNACRLLQVKSALLRRATRDQEERPLGRFYQLLEPFVDTLEKNTWIIHVFITQEQYRKHYMYGITCSLRYHIFRLQYKTDMRLCSSDICY